MLAHVCEELLDAVALSLDIEPELFGVGGWSGGT